MMQRHFSRRHWDVWNVSVTFWEGMNPFLSFPLSSFPKMTESFPSCRLLLSWERKGSFPFPKWLKPFPVANYSFPGKGKDPFLSQNYWNLSQLQLSQNCWHLSQLQPRKGPFNPLFASTSLAASSFSMSVPSISISLVNRIERNYTAVHIYFDTVIWTDILVAGASHCTMVALIY